MCLASRATKPVHRKEHHRNRQSKKQGIAAGAKEITAIFNSEKNFKITTRIKYFLTNSSSFRRQNSPVLETYFLFYPLRSSWYKVIKTSLIGESQTYCLGFNLQKSKNGFHLPDLLELPIFNTCSALFKIL